MRQSKTKNVSGKHRYGKEHARHKTKNSEEKEENKRKQRKRKRRKLEKFENKIIGQTSCLVAYLARNYF